VGSGEVQAPLRARRQVGILEGGADVVERLIHVPLRPREPCTHDGEGRQLVRALEQVEAALRFA